MRTNSTWPICCMLAPIVATAQTLARAAADEPTRPFIWKTAAPETQGMSREKLDALQSTLATHQTRALLVIRNDRIVAEWYAPGHSATKRHYTASMAKAIVGGLAVALAMTDHRIELDDVAAQFIPEWRRDPRKSRITIRHLGSHTSGLEDAHLEGVPHEQLPGWKGDFWKRLAPPHDPFSIARDHTPVLFDAGEKMQYSNPGIAMLGYAVTVSLKESPQQDIRTLIRDRVMRPIGVPDAEWSIGYGKTFAVDSDAPGLVPAWGGGSYTARAVARVARLMLHEGCWDGQQLLSREAVRQTTSDAGMPGNCGIGWWSNNDGVYDKLPRDAYWGSGAGHQIVLVVPSLKLIAVRNGEALRDAAAHPAQYHEPVRELFFEPLMEAFTDRTDGVKPSAPYPPSPVITRIDWAPKEAILRKAHGSDNWPITWGDDDHLYTAYGDGHGFEPFIAEKLSLGLARIEGAPPHVTGVNIRAPTLEQRGDDRAGRKASGLVMVDSVLYLWARNADNAQLAWSTDHGTTWKWCDWRFSTSFGCPTFLNYGKNYAGARDGFVYIYSPDSDSAYVPADRMVLARVPKERIREANAYEYFQGLTSDGEPVWTRHIAERGAVFTHAARCYRSGISYNAGLKRYLWSQVLPESADARGPRFQGGFGVYDAPEPWGPWTTAYYAETWDVGPGEASSLPTKWMSADGQTVQLVFSGDDCFSVRQATLLSL